ncbi:MAG: hypothetical protein HYY18_10415 [Planctomycetes bacterium]|nr:hypothetical protein [Planctomycetota bacterium]
MTAIPQGPSPFPSSVECEAPPVPAGGGEFRLLRPFAVVFGYLAGYAKEMAVDAWRGTWSWVADLPGAVRRASRRRAPKAPAKLTGVCVTPNGLRVPEGWKRAG